MQVVKILVPTWMPIIQRLNNKVSEGTSQQVHNSARDKTAIALAVNAPQISRWPDRAFESSFQFEIWYAPPLQHCAAMYQC